MVNETKKILEKDVQLSATCVRVPTLRGHAEALTLTFEQSIDAEKAKELLENAANIVVIDNPSESLYPMPASCVDQNETFVGRVRADLYNDTILHLFVVADNLRVGAATNAVRIAQGWVALNENQEG